MYDVIKNKPLEGFILSLTMKNKIASGQGLESFLIIFFQSFSKKV